MSKAKTRPTKVAATVDQEKNKDNEVVIDLASFVTQVERFSALVEPFAFVFYAIDDIRRWRFPNFTIAVWIISNICCFVLTQGAVFILISCLVIGLATLSLCQLHTRILDKYLPRTKSDTPRPITEDGTTLETIQNFQYSLIQMHDFIVKSNEYLTYVYAVLKWDDTVPALIYHAEVCVSLLCVVVFPVRWNCFCFFNWFFLCHPLILKRGCSYWMTLADSFIKKGEDSDSSLPPAASATPTSSVPPAASAAPASAPSVLTSSPPASTSQGQTAAGNLLSSAASSPAHHNANTGKTAVPKIKSNADAENVQCDDKDDSDVDLLEMTSSVDDSLSKIEPAPQRPGMVARLLELKKRRAQAANENCYGCKVSFSSILKRRHYCRHCGNSFCHKCCNQKVPRSVFGATSPVATKETVLVCGTCHQQLTTPPSGDSTHTQGLKSRPDTS